MVDELMGVRHMRRNRESDTKRLDFLQQITGGYTGKIICRWSGFGRGWRLHESNREDAVADVREAIDNMMAEETEKIRQSEDREKGKQ